MDRRRVLADAITYAADGFPVTIRNSNVMAEYAGWLAGDPNTAQTFLPHGRPPRLGEVIRQPALGPDRGRVYNDLRDRNSPR